MATTTTTPPCLPPPTTLSDAPSPRSASAYGDHDSRRSEEKLKELKRKQRQEKILRRAIPILLSAPWLLGLLWTALHPLVSVATGELKCRGKYIDENSMDVHRHSVEKYPLERTAVDSHKLKGGRKDNAAAATSMSGMCDAIRSADFYDMSPSVECLRHVATETIAFDITRILPSMGPVREPTEAVVLVVGDHSHSGIQQGYNGNEKIERHGNWYERSDMNASILHLVKKLGNKKDSPWLTKTVFIVSPATNEMSGNTSPPLNIESSKNLGSLVDAFIESYLGDSPVVHPLQPDFTFPMIRSVLVLSNVEATSSSNNNSRTEVRILPHGIGGALPNLDLVFATFMSFQTLPAGARKYDQSQTIYYGNAEFRAHPFGDKLEEQVGQVLRKVSSIIGFRYSAMQQYAKELAGMFGFVAAMVIGPRQPHSSALNHGIDALTIEVLIPGNRVASSSSIHPHYADLIRCVEHLLRAISNLHERLHHSVAQYIMPSPSKFVSHGEYIFPAILVSLPMVVRAATLALRDLKRFQFLHTGMVVGSVIMSTIVISVWTIFANKTKKIEDSSLAWIPIGLYSISYLLVVLVAQQHQAMPQKRADVNKQMPQAQFNHSDECRGSLRFIGCLLAIYIHAPLLLANYSLGFPSSVFWTPLLATLVLPPSWRVMFFRNKALSAVSMLVKCLFILATSPPVLFEQYTVYVLGVHTPLHLILAALWLA